MIEDLGVEVCIYSQPTNTAQTGAGEIFGLDFPASMVGTRCSVLRRNF